MAIRATGQSMNGQRRYEVTVDTVSPAEARQTLRSEVVRQVRDQFGSVPTGVPWLVDPRTIETEETA